MTLRRSIYSLWRTFCPRRINSRSDVLFWSTKRCTRTRKSTRYKMSHEYNWNVNSKISKGYEENYLMVLRQYGMYYNELKSRVRLSIRLQKVVQPPDNTKQVVKHRQLNAPQHRMQRYRELQLEPASVEDEEEIEDKEPEESEEEYQEHRKARNQKGKTTGENAAEAAPAAVHPSPAFEQAPHHSRSGSCFRSRSRSRFRFGSGPPAGSDKSRSRSRSGSAR